MAKTASKSASAALSKSLRPDLFRALGDPMRVALVVRLACASGPQTVTEVSSCCGIHLSGISRHLAMLRDAGVVHVEKHGREARYRVDAAELAGALRALADALERCQAGRCASPERESK